MLEHGFQSFFLSLACWGFHRFTYPARCWSLLIFLPLVRVRRPPLKVGKWDDPRVLFVFEGLSWGLDPHHVDIFVHDFSW